MKILDLFLLVCTGLSAYGCDRAPSYFTCSGTKMAQGQDVEAPLENVSLKIQAHPVLNQMVFSLDRYGTVEIDHDDHSLFWITTMNDKRISFGEADDVDSERYGVFNRVSHRLTAHTYDAEIDLVCDPAQPAKL